MNTEKKQPPTLATAALAVALGCDRGYEALRYLYMSMRAYGRESAARHAAGWAAATGLTVSIDDPAIDWGYIAGVFE